ncbi:MAG: insulinase family protein [Gammaproteobacteria bacterium]|nr:insulinase family protein [Gammaproteobacteria bacterium]
MVKPPEQARLQKEPVNGVYSYQLANGMDVLVKPDHRSPVVVSQVWYKVGGSYEQRVTGVSHVLEHMMFKGTPTHPAGKFSEIIAANGGSENAFTGMDYTAYFQRIAADRLEICLQLEADRMRNLVLDESEFKKEVEVVKEERRMRTDDDPTALTYEHFNAVAYTSSTYGQPIIGWMDDLNTMSIQDMRDWYATWYAPNNATLVVAGDVEPEAVLALAKKYFGPLKPSTLTPPRPRQEVTQQGERRLVVKVPAEVPYLIMGYKVPVLNTLASNNAEPWEAYALDVLAGVLDGGNSSRLASELIRGQSIASSAGAGYDLYARQDNLFMLDASPTGDTTVAQLEKALREQINKIQNQPPSQSEMERVKAQVMASTVYEQDSVFYQAMQLGTLQTVGLGWQKKADYLNSIQAITAEQVQAVARKYLTPERLTVAQLEPLPIDPKQPPRMHNAGGGHVR